MLESELKPKSKFIYYILDEHGNPRPAKSEKEWDDWMQNNYEKRLVKRDVLDPGIVVSTVFIGLGIGFDDDDPCLFETATFLDEKFLLNTDDYDCLTGVCTRYTKQKDAEIGHAAILKDTINKLNKLNSVVD